MGAGLPQPGQATGRVGDEQDGQDEQDEQGRPDEQSPGDELEPAGSTAHVGNDVMRAPPFAASTSNRPRRSCASRYEALLTEDMLKSPTRQVGMADRVK